MTTREEVERHLARFVSRVAEYERDIAQYRTYGDPAEVAPHLSATVEADKGLIECVRALLAERNAAQTKAKDFARLAYDAERKAVKANIDATALAGLDAMEIQPVLMAVQEWAISTGKARDLLRCWIVGTFTPDMLPQQMRDLGLSDDADPAECFLAMRSERDAARAECKRLREALERLEDACDARAKGTTRAAYDAAISSGMAHLLTDLDSARRQARAALTGAKP